jgi:PAS domain S-box-containing protein
MSSVANCATRGECTVIAGLAESFGERTLSATSAAVPALPIVSSFAAVDEAADFMAKLRILIVDDEVIARELETRLTTLGYEVVAIAFSGDEAIAVAALTAPDLVLMGTRLGGKAGGGAAADAIRQHRSIPVVFMGNEADEANLQPAGLAGPYGYLVPPFSDRELRVNIELVLCRHAAERAVHELDGFFAVSVDMFCFLDFNGYFKRLNPAWERTLGFTREELMSRPFIDFVHPDDRERTLNQNADVRRGGQATGFENRYLCKDGSHRWLLWNATAQLADGVIYSAARDITVWKQAEAERAQLMSKLQASLEEVRSLQEILPICMYCKNIRDDENYWDTVESYISRHTKTRFSHGICPRCMVSEVEPQFDEAGSE